MNVNAWNVEEWVFGGEGTTGWPADLEFLEKKFLEKSGNFVALEKCQEILGNWEKSGNFNAKLRKVREFYMRETNIVEISSKFIQVVNKN